MREVWKVVPCKLAAPGIGCGRVESLYMGMESSSHYFRILFTCLLGRRKMSALCKVILYMGVDTPNERCEKRRNKQFFWFHFEINRVCIHTYDAPHDVQALSALVVNSALSPCFLLYLNSLISVRPLAAEDEIKLLVSPIYVAHSKLTLVELRKWDGTTWCIQNTIWYSVALSQSEKKCFRHPTLSRLALMRILWYCTAKQLCMKSSFVITTITKGHSWSWNRRY